MERNFLGGNKFNSLCAWAGEPSQTLRKEKTFRAPKSFLKVLVGCSFWFLGGFLLGALLVCRPTLYQEGMVNEIGVWPSFLRGKSSKGPGFDSHGLRLSLLSPLGMGQAHPPQKKKNLVEPEKCFFLLRVWVGFPANACKELNLLPPKKFFPPVSAFKTLAILHKKKKILAPKSCFGIKSLEGFLSCGRGGLQNPLLSPKFFWTRLSPSKTKDIPISARLPSLSLLLAAPHRASSGQHHPSLLQLNQKHYVQSLHPQQRRQLISYFRTTSTK